MHVNIVSLLYLLTYFNLVSFPRYTAISVENRKKNSHLPYILRPAEGVPLELGIGVGGQKTRMMGLPGRHRSLMVSSAVWIEFNLTADI